MKLSTKLWSKTEKSNDNQLLPCHCVGPQNGEPMCPCLMNKIKIEKGEQIKIRGVK